MTIAISFGVYTLLIVGVGLLAGRATTGDDEDYFLAGRKLGPWIAALSAGASGSSAWVTMGLVGLAFRDGLRAYWLIPGVLVGVGFNWFFLASRMRERSGELGAVTIPDLLAMHFRERLPILRLMSVLVVLSAMFLYVAAQMAAAGQAFGAVFGLNYQIGVGLGAGIVLAYTVFGGFRSACWTDAAQAILMLVALVGMPIIIVLQGTGLGGAIEALRRADPELVRLVPEVGGLALVGFLLGSGALGINLGYPGQPHVLVRLMAVRDRRDIVRSGVIQLCWTILIIGGAITTGVLVRGIAEGGAVWGEPLLAEDMHDRSLALLVAAANLLPGVVAGFVLAGVLSAMASTADSQLIVAASSASRDAYEKVLGGKRGKAQGWINRGTVLIFGLGAAALVLNKDVKIYQFVIDYGWAMLGASFGPQLILLLLWKRATYIGCIAGMVTGFATVILWKLFYNPDDFGGVQIYNLAVGFTLAIAVNGAVSLVTPANAVQPHGGGR